jgi:hypothetical protein
MEVRERAVRGCLGVAALIHLLPVSGVLGADRLRALYDVVVNGPDLAILMRHRAVLFAIVGGLLAAAVIRAHLRATALAAGFLSVVSFLALAVTSPHNAALGRVVVADVVALLALVIAAALHRGRAPAS